MTIGRKLEILFSGLDQSRSSIESCLRDSVDKFVDWFKPFGLNPSSISLSYGYAENCTFYSTARGSHSDFSNIPTHKKLLPSARLDEDNDPDMNVTAVNEDAHELVDDGVEGEIWVSSPSNCSDYLSHPSLTGELFQARLNNTISKCFIRTGDRVVKGENRYLYVTCRCSDVIKLRNGREVQPHFIGTTGHNSCWNYLRGGCLAAFEVSGTVALVAEMKRAEKEGFEEEIKKAVSREEQVELGLVVLVRSRSVPKGKIQRWVAKYNLTEAKMEIVMEMRFEADGYRFFFLLEMVRETDIICC